MKNSPFVIWVFVALAIAVSCHRNRNISYEISEDDWLSSSVSSEQKALVIVLDTSSSMSGERMKQAKTALSTYISSLDENVFCGLVTFGRGNYQIGTPKEEIIRHVEGLDTSGSTPLTEAVLTAYKMHEEIWRESPPKEYHIAIITDGKADEPMSLEFLVNEIINKKPIQLTTIGFQIRGGHSLNRPGIKYLEADNFEELSKGLHQILVEEPLPQ